MMGRSIKPVLLVGLMLAAGMACNFGGGEPTPTPGLAILEAPAVTALADATASKPAEQPAQAGATLQAPATPEVPLPTPQIAGLSIVYVKDGNLWHWMEGQGRQLTSSGRVYVPRLSPDGKMIAFLRPADDFHMELWAIQVDGTQERRLVRVEDLDTIGGGVRDPSAAAVNPYHFEWIPGSHRLAFNTHQVFQGPGLALLDDLNIVDADSGEISYLLLSGWGGEFYYSPDGKQIAITTPSSVILADADGSNYRKVLDYAPVNTYSEYRFYARPYWSANGAYLRLALPPADPLARPAEPTTLWTITVDGSTPPRQDGSVSAVAFFETPVAYSPDLERIIYLQEAGQPAENLRQLWLATFDGQGAWAYEKAPMLRFEGWATDGKHFTYAAGENGEMHLGGLERAAQPFNRDPYGIQSMRWVDSERLLYIQQRSGVFDFYLATIDGQSLLLDTITGDPPAFYFILAPSG